MVGPAQYGKLVFVLFAGFIGTSCGFLFPGGSPDPEQGAITVEIDATDISAEEFEVSGTGPGNAAFSLSTSDTSVPVEDLVPGAWDVTVVARGEGAAALGSGFSAVEVVGGITTSVAIVVSAAEGLGDFAVSIDWSQGFLAAPAVDGRLTSRAGAEYSLNFDVGSQSATASREFLPTGYYTLSLGLIDEDVRVAGATEVVRIANDLTTSGQFWIDPTAGVPTLEGSTSSALAVPGRTSLTGVQDALPVNESRVLSASVDGAEAVSVTWHVQGAARFNIAEPSVSGKDYGRGSFRVDLVASYELHGQPVLDAATGTLVIGAATESFVASSLELGTTVADTNAGALSSNVMDDFACATFDTTGPEIVYEVSPKASGRLVFELSDFSGDLDLLVLEEVAGNYDPSSTEGCMPGGVAQTTAPTERVEVAVLADTRYFVVVDGYNGTSSSFELFAGSTPEHLRLDEIAGIGADDEYFELVNDGADAVDLAGVRLYHTPDLQAEALEFSFAAGAEISPGSRIRLVEGTAIAGNEVSLGTAIADQMLVGYTMLCDGPCDTSGCLNIIDYMERDNDPTDADDAGGPSCVSFTPAPLDGSGASTGQSWKRAGNQGGGTTFYASDWSIGTATSAD